MGMRTHRRRGVWYKRGAAGVRRRGGGSGGMGGVKGVFKTSSLLVLSNSRFCLLSCQLWPRGQRSSITQVRKFVKNGCIFLKLLMLHFLHLWNYRLSVSKNKPVFLIITQSMMLCKMWVTVVKTSQFRGSGKTSTYSFLWLFVPSAEPQKPIALLLRVFFTSLWVSLNSWLTCPAKANDLLPPRGFLFGARQQTDGWVDLWQQCYQKLWQEGNTVDELDFKLCHWTRFSIFRSVSYQ